MSRVAAARAGEVLIVKGRPIPLRCHRQNPANNPGLGALVMVWLRLGS
ncbi:hypothetical protein ALQ02_200109 [Pseudomonas savastanoi pv. phaseolicola]|nr:hypothetical protein ALQ02_200109 [Pseudomonas savastanoi pv. phaseolicola]